MNWIHEFEDNGVLSMLEAFNGITDLGADPEIVARAIISAAARAVAAVRGSAECVRLLREAADIMEARGDARH